MKVLREYFELCEGGVCQDHLTESEKKYVKDGGVILTGKLQEANVRNGNGRIYQKHILQREVENYMKAVRENRALGELDHPDDSVVNLKNASHMVTDLWWEGPAVWGKIKVLNTPSGKILQNLVQDGVQLGISSRGLGSLSETPEGAMVQEDFQLICFDMVSEPSTPGAYMHLSEAKNIDTNKVFTKADRINRALNDVLRKG